MRKMLCRFLLAWIWLLPSCMPAQERSTALLRVRVVTDDAPVADATIVVRSSGRDSIATARTDKSGWHAFVLPAGGGGEFQIVARKPGFAPDTVSVTLNAPDSLEVYLSLRPLVTKLAPIVSRTHPDYFIDSTQMAGSGRIVRDAFEVLTKLRPNMLGDKGRCPADPVDNVWINGKSMLRFASFTNPRNFRRARLHGGSGESPLVDSVLASIRAEHLAEIRYVNCWQRGPRPDAAAVNAIFVVLKPGIGWDWGRGSYVDSTAKKPPR